MSAMRRWVFVSLLFVSALALADKPITITLLHSNDLHAHIEPTKIKGQAYGGYARQATIIKRIRATEPNVMLLSGGDTFQGTLFFNTYEGLADLAFMNAVHYDAMAVGNHEFDRGPKPLGTFASMAAFPVLSANLDVSGEPALNGIIRDSAVVTVGGEKFGIVGATTPTVTNISSPGPTVKLKDLHDSIQGAVDRLQSQGIDRIFLVTHIGYAEDQALVKTLHGVCFVVGAHSHTPLGTPDLPGWPKSQGPYPTVVKDSQGVSVPIVQCWEGQSFRTHHVGFRCQGASGSMAERETNRRRFVDSRRYGGGVNDRCVQAADRGDGEPAGRAGRHGTSQGLAGRRRQRDGRCHCRRHACGYVERRRCGSVRQLWWGSRRSEPGKVTYGELISIEPFGNTLVLLDLTGAELRAALEEGIGTGGELNPSKGTSYSIDRSKPAGSRVSDVVISGAALDPGKTYRVTFLNFTSNGGDAHQVLKDAKGARTDTGMIDLDALIDFVKAHNPLTDDEPGRIRIR